MSIFIYDMMGRKVYRILLYVTLTVSAFSCIKNDIPYPVVELEILGIDGTGFTCTAQDINTADRTVTLHLDETTDISRVRIENISVTEKSDISLEIPGDFDLRANLEVTLSLYDDYEWTIKAEQKISREFHVEGQIGESQFFEDSFKVVAKVPKEGFDMNNVKITKLKLGPEGITEMNPSPEEITSFETYRTVDIKYHDFSERWSLYLEPTDIKVQISGADAWTRIIWVYAQGVPGKGFGIKYRKQGVEAWTDVPEEKITVEGGSFRSMISGLEPETVYEVQALSGDDVSETVILTTGKEIQLPNFGFEEWSKDGNTVFPGVSSADALWGTGNPGASIARIILTDKSEDIRPGSSGNYSAKLESKMVGLFGVGKFAAGNLFLGRFIGTRGTDGIVGFGRPYAERPVALKVWAKYNCGEVTDVPENLPPDIPISKGDSDVGIIYIALGTWTPEEYGVCKEEEPGETMLGTNEVPICIDTRDRNTFFNPKSSAVIAYGELVFDKTVSEWKEFTIKLTYNNTSVVPTHAVIVCSASRYGDYYAGSRNSVMYVDDFEFVYDEL